MNCLIILAIALTLAFLIYQVTKEKTGKSSKPTHKGGFVEQKEENNENQTL